MDKSELLNSYGIFHPNGPYILLSYITAWNIHNPNNNFFLFSRQTPVFFWALFFYRKKELI